MKMTVIQVHKKYRSLCCGIFLFHIHFQQMMKQGRKAAACQIDASVEIECHFSEGNHQQNRRQIEQSRKGQVFRLIFQTFAQLPAINQAIDRVNNLPQSETGDHTVLTGKAKNKNLWKHHHQEVSKNQFLTKREFLQPVFYGKFRFTHRYKSFHLQSDI